MSNSASHLRLTERDFCILKDVFENTMMSFSNLSGRHFGGAARVTVQNRLSQLYRGGFLSRMRVGSVVYHGEPKFIGVIYQMTRLGLKVLQQRYPEMAIRPDPVSIDTGSLVHDLTLLCVLDFLKKRVQSLKWENAKNVLSGSKVHVRQPDLVGFSSMGKALVGVELEMTVKSERSYREIINQYALTSQYKAVLYIVGSESIGDKIREVVNGVKGHLNRDLFPTGKFYFAKLSDIQRGTLNVEVTNGKQHFGSELERILAQAS